MRSLGVTRPEGDHVQEIGQEKEPDHAIQTAMTIEVTPSKEDQGKEIVRAREAEEVPYDGQEQGSNARGAEGEAALEKTRMRGRGTTEKLTGRR